MSGSVILITRSFGFMSTHWTLTIATDMTPRNIYTIINNWTSLHHCEWLQTNGDGVDKPLSRSVTAWSTDSCHLYHLSSFCLCFSFWLPTPLTSPSSPTAPTTCWGNLQLCHIARGCQQQTDGRGVRSSCRLGRYWNICNCIPNTAVVSKILQKC